MMKQPINLYVFVSVLFVVGGVFGALLVNALTLEQQQDLAAEVDQYMRLMQTSGAASEAEAFWARFLFYGKWLVLIWLLGITVAGVPGILALNFLKGTLIGFSLGLLLRQYAWKGLFFAVVAIAPQNVIAVPAMIMASAASISFAIFLVKDRLLQQKGSLAPQFGSFTSTTVMMAFLLAIAALFEAYVSPALIDWAAPFLLS